MIRLAYGCFLVMPGIAGCAPAATTDAGVHDDGVAPVAAPLFPADVEEAFEEARDCRRSIDHDLSFVRVFADATAHGPYTTRAEPFPAGATLVKVQYADEECVDVVGFVAMQKRVTGEAPDSGDWIWQRASAERGVLEHGDLQSCVFCHSGCNVAGGYDWTCTEP